MKVKRFFVLLTALFILAACQANEQPNLDALPADFNYAAGAYPHAVTLNGVNVRVDDVGIVLPDEAVKPGYSYIAVTINVTNQSDDPVDTSEFRLIDEYLNLYESWQTNVSFGHELTAMPPAIGPGQTATGEQVFIVPDAAQLANLRLRWQSIEHVSRIDLSLGTLPTTP